MINHFPMITTNSSLFFNIPSNVLFSSVSSSFRFCSSINSNSNSNISQQQQTKPNSKKKEKLLSISAIVGKFASQNDCDGALAAIRGFISTNNMNNTQKQQQQQSLPTSALTTVMYCCEKHNRQQEAIDLAKEIDSKQLIKGGEWDEASLTTLQRLMCECDDIVGASATLKVMLEQQQKEKEKKLKENEKCIILPFIKRRSIAPLANLCAKRVVVQQQQNKKFHDEGIFYGTHLYDLTVSQNIELDAVDCGNFAEIFDAAATTNSSSSSSNSSESEKKVKEMLSKFSEHTSVLENEEKVDEHLSRALAVAGYGHSKAKQNDVVEIDPTSGICSNCNIKLDAVPLTESDRTQLLHDIEVDLINHAIEKKRKISKNSSFTTIKQNQKANQIRAGFKSFQQYFLQQKPDVLIDGANLGYYGLSKWYGLAKAEMLQHQQYEHQNHHHHHHDTMKQKSFEEFKEVKYDKKDHRFHGVDVPPNMKFVDLAVSEVESRGLKPLVVFHVRHLEKKNLLPSSVPIVEKWQSKRCVFATPTGLNDDICWLWGIVSAASTSTDEKNNNNTLVLTNDLMRDHHFALLSRRAFTRMRDRKQIKFSAKWSSQGTLLSLQFPPVYSSFLQLNCSDSHSSSNSNNNNCSSSSSYHVPFYVKKKVENQKNVENANDNDEEEFIEEIKWKCFPKKKVD